MIKLFWITNLLLINIAFAAEPTLLDLKVVGTVDKPDFEPQKLELKEGQPYLLVVINDNPYSASFHFDKLSQALSTQYMKGSPNVSQGSLLVLPNSKVLWQFIPKSGGDFEYYAVNTSFNQPGPKNKITIKPLEEPVKLPDPWADDNAEKTKNPKREFMR